MTKAPAVARARYVPPWFQLLVCFWQSISPMGMRHIHMPRSPPPSEEQAKPSGHHQGALHHLPSPREPALPLIMLQALPGFEGSP